jgi:anthranilate phosphoribosyltransferase
MSDGIRAVLARVVSGERLTRDEARATMGAVLDGEVTPAQLAGLLVALRMRGETVDELAGFVEAMRQRAIAVEAPEGSVDTCGTGGDVHHTFNISTAAALVVAASGVPVAKHGNRAVTSASGSSDVIQALGVTVEQGPDEASAALREVGFAFLHAPGFHPGMRHAGPTRRELGVRTAFNLVGPLANPAGVRRQLVGVAEAAAAEHVANVLHALGTERAFVVHGERVDELPLDGSGVLYDVSPTGITRRAVTPEEAGLTAARTEELAGGDARHNATIIEAVLTGRRGPQRDVVILNAAAALVVAGRAADLDEGAAQAGMAIDSGAAREGLELLRQRETRRASALATSDPAAAGAAA